MPGELGPALNTHVRLPVLRNPVRVQAPPFLGGVCMFSPCPRGSSPGSLVPAAERKLVGRVKNQPRITKKKICQELEAAGLEYSCQCLQSSVILHRRGLGGCSATWKLAPKAAS
ncbi:uncharacterized protein LOC144001625 [Festucalex cinctus]